MTFPVKVFLKLVSTLSPLNVKYCHVFIVQIFPVVIYYINFKHTNNCVAKLVCPNINAEDNNEKTDIV